jgi:ATP-dependent DNA helicase RecQ
VELFRLADGRECRHKALARYFDETLAPCATSCDACRGEGLDALIGPARAIGLARPARGAAALPPAEGEFDAATFQRLRALRKRLADAEGVPAYIVFSDAVLRAMAARLPRTAAEMLGVPGVGPVKLERYGAAFLDALGGSS